MCIHQRTCIYILKFLLEARSCYVAQDTWDLRFSSASWVHTLPHLALKLILISIIRKSMALFSRLWSRGARPTVNIQNWRGNSNFESTILGHSDKAHHSEVKQKQPPCCSITLKPWLFAKEVERNKPSVTETDISGDGDAEAKTSGSFFMVLRTGPRETGFDLASTGTAKLWRKTRQLMPAKAYSAP